MDRTPRGGRGAGSATDGGDRPRAAALARVSSASASLDLLSQARPRLAAAFDPLHGGFGRAPKFPRPWNCSCCCACGSATGDPRRWRWSAAHSIRWPHGGMYDHLGGGFARYWVDDQWLVPSFRKNALRQCPARRRLPGRLSATRDPRYAGVAQETLDYVLRDMRRPRRGFHSSEDADSEGEEGKYYVWTVEEVVQLLGEAAGRRFCEVYGVTPRGNFEGKSILHRAQTVEQGARSKAGIDARQLAAELSAARQQLLDPRRRRCGRAKTTRCWSAGMR